MDVSHHQLQQPRQQQPATAPGWPLHLPATAQQAVVACLTAADQCSLRLACSTTAALVAEGIRKLELRQSALLGCSWPLARRFTSLTKLCVDYRPNEEETDTEQLNQGLAACMSMALPSVTSLYLGGLLPAATAAVVATCPNAESCNVQYMREDGVDSRNLPIPENMQHICAALSRLRSLKLSNNHYLGAPELAALATCHSLAELHAPLRELSSGGWALLLGMTGLTRLEVYTTHEVVHALQRLPPGMQVDLRPLSNLKRLQLGTGCYCGPHPDSTEEQRIRRVYRRLIPPITVTSMKLQHMFAYTAAAPHLTQLELVSHQIAANGLRSLASGCPVLVELHVCQIFMNVACHAAPLQALTMLVVQSTCTAAAGVRMAAVFPRLKLIALRCECDIATPHSFFANASTLQTLDVGREGEDEDSETGLSMDQSTLAVLSGLPSLNFLRVNAEPLHVIGLEHLAHVTALHFILEAEHASDALRSAFTTSTAPPSLHTASFWFKGVRTDPIDHDLFVHPFVLVADAAVDWCIRAPALQSVCWDLEEAAACQCAALTSVRLWALSASTSIQHMLIDEFGYNAESTAQLLPIIAQLLSRGRRLDVVIGTPQQL